MIEKSRGIVLQQIKYSDSGIITRFYTRDHGGLSILVKGMRQKRSGKHNVYFQPLYILDMEIYNKDGRGIQLLKEFTPSFIPEGIQTNMKKTCTALFLGEVLSAVIREEEVNAPLFDYIEKSVKYFDACVEPFANFHVSFLAGLCKYLGFAPQVKADEDAVYFDFVNGKFVVMPPVHGGYANEEVSGILLQFFQSSFDEANHIKLSGRLRDTVLDTVLDYYSTHVTLTRKINSLDVLKEVFS